MTGWHLDMNGKKLGAIAIVAGFVVQLVALGIAWGTMQTRVSDLEKDVDGMPESIAVIGEKIDNLEDAVDDIRDLLRPTYRP